MLKMDILNSYIKISNKLFIKNQEEEVQSCLEGLEVKWRPLNKYLLEKWLRQEVQINRIDEYRVLYDTGHPDHLNKSINGFLWKETVSILEDDGVYILIKIRKLFNRST